MRIGIFTALFGDKSLVETLDLVKAEGIEAVELGAGAYPGSAHLDVEKLLQSQAARDELLEQVNTRGLQISAISCHGNPVHPNRAIAAEHHRAFVNSVKLASLLGVKRVNGFSGCPGDHDGAQFPNWVTCAWPDEYRDILDYQWNQVLIPYWKEQHKLLEDHDTVFGIEMHPGFSVYNNQGFFKLREAAGPRIGANFDPSHLWWQGIDPIESLRELGLARAVFHVHAKDVRIDPHNSRLNGNLDTNSYGDLLNRSWVFRTVGYGHSVEWWKDFCSTLRLIGYDGVISIEHEDGYMSPLEGLRKAVAVLKEARIEQPAGQMFWAKE